MKLISTKGKHVRNVQRKSAVALLLSTCLIFPYLIDAATAFQTGEAVCPNHPEHDEFCHYAEYMPGSPCTHEHDDSCYQIELHSHTAECYAAMPDFDENNFTDEDSPADGSIGEPEPPEKGENEALPAASDGEAFPEQYPSGTDSGSPEDKPETVPDNAPPADMPDAAPVPDDPDRTLICGLEEGEEVQRLDCPHKRGEHTEECGYTEEIPAADCEHHCELCLDNEEIQQYDEMDAVNCKVVNEAELITALHTAGTITLQDDFSVSSELEIANRNITLDLNGHTIEFIAPADNKSLFKVTSGGVLTVLDSAFSSDLETVEKVNNAENTMAIYEDDTLTYYQTISTTGKDNISTTTTYQHKVCTNGRLFSRNSGYTTDALVSLDGGTLNLNSGMLANVGGQHNIVSITNSKINMSGGYLVGADATGNGGGILAGNQCGTVSISGGVIAANRAGGNGGGIHFDSTAALTISNDAVITGNYAKNYGGGIHSNRLGVLAVNNYAVISGNKSESDPNCNSIAVSQSSILQNDGTIDTSKIKVSSSCEIEGMQEVTRGAFHSFLSSEWEKIKSSSEPKIITLNESYTGDGSKVVFPYIIEKGVSFTLDLAGNSVEYSGDGTLFLIKKGGSLTITDSCNKYRTQNLWANCDSSSASLTDEWELTYYTTSDTSKDGNPPQTTTQKNIIDLKECGKLFSNSVPNDSSKTADSIVKVDGGAFKLESGVLANRKGVHNILSMNGGTVEMTGGYVIGAHCVGGNGGGILAGSTSGDITVSGGVIAANKAEGKTNTIGSGGAIFSSGSGKIILTGTAVVSGNTSSCKGGGVAHGGTSDIEVSGSAVICHNRSTGDNGGGISHYGPYVTGNIILKDSAMVSCNQAFEKGGGVSNFISKGSLLISNNVVISHNTAKHGAGIATKSMTLEGGTVDGNTASGVGGGIMVAQNGGFAEISGTDDTKVYITNNTAQDTGTHGFAGGGIFVEHPDKNAPDSGIAQSRLMVKNALITDNYAQYGGGIAGCGTSEVLVFAIEGAAIFENHASQKDGVMEGHFNDPNRKLETNNSQDIFCVSDRSTVSKTMLSTSNQAEWFGLQGPYGRYTNVADSDWGEASMRKFNQPIYLTSRVDSKIQKEEKNFAKVIISGNTSRSGGGGIGGNGHIQLGMERALVIEKKVNSILAADKTAQFPFTIELKQDGKPLVGTFAYTIVRKDSRSEHQKFSGGTLECKLADGDRVTIYGLPEDDKTISYTVTENLAVEEDYKTEITGSDIQTISSSTVTGNIDKNEVETLLFTNNKRMNITVIKVWEDDNNAAGKRPAEIKVELLRRNSTDGEYTSFPDNGHTKETLSEENGWTCTWNDLDGTYEYLIDEIDVPDGYTSVKTVSPDRKTRTLTNALNRTGVTVVKEWQNKNGEKDEISLPPYVEVRLIGRTETPYPEEIIAKGQNGEEKVRLDPSNHWSYTWSHLPKGYTWRVEEVNIPEGYTYQTEILYDKNHNLGNIDDQNIPVKIINTYTNTADKGKLTLSKRVEGAQTDRAFTFTIELKQPNGKPLEGTYPYSGSCSGTIADGGKVQLKHGESIQVTELPIGTQFTISETDRGNYVASVRTDGVFGNKSGAIQQSGNTVEYTNAPPSPPGVIHPPHEYEDDDDDDDDDDDEPDEETPPGDPEDPETPPTDPENPPEEPETPDPEDPETPDPEEPETPPEEPEYYTELPDPNLPGSPERLTLLDENDVPRTYVKVWDPEDEEWVYIPEDEIPLAPMDGTPQTGDGARPVLWGGLCAASLGVGFQLLPRSRKKRRIRRRRRDSRR